MRQESEAVRVERSVSGVAGVMKSRGTFSMYYARVPIGEASWEVVAVASRCFWRQSIPRVRAEESVEVVIC